jgi:uncharacterized protein (DUF1330 family)
MGLPGFRSLVRGVSNHGGRPILRDGRHAMIECPESASACVLLRMRRIFGQYLGSRFSFSEIRYSAFRAPLRRALRQRILAS